MNTPTTPQARVSKITVGRLHSLGNYEHVRYEIAVDIPDGSSASDTLRNLERILNGLDPKPPVSDYDLQRASAALVKASEAGEEGLEEWERGNIETYRKYVARHAKWNAERTWAHDALDAIGGIAIHADAKDSWDD